MEKIFSVVERMTSEQGRVLTKVKAEVIAMKENFLELKELICDSLPNG